MALRNSGGTFFATALTISGYAAGFYFSVQNMIRISETPDRWLVSVVQIGASVAALLLLILYLQRQGMLGRRDLIVAHVVLVALAALHYRGSSSELAVGLLGGALFGAPLSLLAWLRNGSAQDAPQHHPSS